MQRRRGPPAMFHTQYWKAQNDSVYYIYILYIIYYTDTDESKMTEKHLIIQCFAHFSFYNLTLSLRRYTCLYLYTLVNMSEMFLFLFYDLPNMNFQCLSKLNVSVLCENFKM